MGIFLSKKNTLRCPTCGGYADKRDAYSMCPECNCKLITEDEYRSTGYNYSDKPVVECPYCHSKDTKKISGLSKVGSVALFGIFALEKTSKQFHCNHCGADF